MTEFRNFTIYKTFIIDIKIRMPDLDLSFICNLSLSLYLVQIIFTYMEINLDAWDKRCN